MSKKIKYLILHCTATPEGRKVTRKDIERWHLIERGWSRVGYSDMIHLDGTVDNLIPYNDDDIIDPWELSNGASGYNSISRHVVYVGGSSAKKNALGTYGPKDTRTPEQIQALKEKVEYFVCQYPNIKVIGHNQISNKSCPSFDVPNWLRSIGINEKNIGI